MDLCVVRRLEDSPQSYTHPVATPVGITVGNLIDADGS